MASDRTTGRRLSLPESPKLVGRDGRTLEARTTPKRLIEGDLRRVTCTDERHPVHVLMWNGSEWEQVPDLHPLAAAMIGATLVIQTMADPG